MKQHMKDLYRILCGEATRPVALSEGGIRVSISGLSMVVALLGLIYGVCMGVFALMRLGEPGYSAWGQMAATTIKVPALFFLTLVVTFPSLFVFNALIGSRLTFRPLLELLVAAMGVSLAVLASLGPIVTFFSVTTTSYSFMVLLNVVVFAVAGSLGLTFMLQTLNRLTIVQEEAERIEREQKKLPVAAVIDNPEPEPAEPTTPYTAFDDTTTVDSAAPPSPESLDLTKIQPGALDQLEGHVLRAHVKTVFRCWVLLFGVVGAQMAWVLRPFLGAPGLPFTWFRERQSNFFEAVRTALVDFLGM